MTFRKIVMAKTSPDNPELLFNDLRTRRVTGLLAHQADILRAYCKDEVINNPDVALQLPTGSGKTLVGLLIAEWRRRKFNERVIYLCPTKQLVNQVVRQATHDYGLTPTGFTGKQRDYSVSEKNRFLQAQTVAVTTYSSLFSSPTFFKESNIIILDDIHAAENFIAQQWSIEITRNNKSLFDALVSLLKNTLSHSEYARLATDDDNRYNFEWVDKISTPMFYSLIPELTGILEEYTQNSELQYSWARIRDHLAACQMYITSDCILIRPVIPPTRTHTPFAHAKQRIYMSATLGKGGELERLSGVEKITRLPIPGGWDKQGIGRRLFLFPELSMNEDDAIDLSLRMVPHAKRALILAPNSRDVVNFRNKLSKFQSYSIYESSDLEAGKDNFIEKENAVALMANRYEGIDFVDDECRLLIVAGIARATNLQERFLINKTCSVVLYNDRIITRIVQAIGRCTRSPNDYSAVVILGDELSRYLIQQEHRILLHPELQGEVDFGVQQSENRKPEEFVNNLDIFLNQDDDWQAADASILELREGATQSQLPAIEALKRSVNHEVRYQYALWNENYIVAVDECRNVLNQLSGDELKGYRAFWNYLGGSAAWIGSKNGIAEYETIARDFYERAAGSAPAIRWLSKLVFSSPENQEQDANKEVLAVVERLELVLEKLGTANNRKFEEKIKQIWESINSSDSDIFEEGHKQLGILLGYDADNSSSTAAPDPWWIADDTLCIVFEDHYPGNQEGCIGANKVRQVASHPKWLQDNDKVSKTTRVVPAIISPREIIQKDAVSFAENVRYWNMHNFQQWVQTALTTVRNLRRTFPEAGNLTWRARAIEAYNTAGISPLKLIDSVLSKKLCDLPVDEAKGS